MSEKCKGCDAEAQSHPYVGIGKENESDRGFKSFPVCWRCHADPSNRKRILKLHFFSKRQAEAALSSAGSSNLGGG